MALRLPHEAFTARPLAARVLQPLGQAQAFHARSLRGSLPLPDT